MERELITSEYSYREVKIEETKIKTFSKDDRMNRSFRVYDGGYAGIQFVQGSADEDTCYKKAQDNLILKRPYKFPLETGVRHRDKTEREYSDKELVLILVPRDLTDKILHALYRAVGLKTPGQGIAFSLPVDQVVGLSTFSEGENGEQKDGAKSEQTNDQND